MKPNKEQKTIDYYNATAESWTKAHGGYTKTTSLLEEMKLFNQLLPQGKILEIGSGSGADAETLINMGYDYTGTDISIELLKIAQKRNPQGKFKLTSVYDLDFGTEKFDGFWSAATLLHIPKDRINEALQRIKSQIKPSGIGFISLKAGAGEREDVKTGRWFAYYSKSGFAEILQRNGFKLLKQTSHKKGAQWWLCFLVKV